MNILVKSPNIDSNLNAYRYIRDHLLKQNSKAMLGNTCRYRGMNSYKIHDEDLNKDILCLDNSEYWDGTSCAVGCLITDDAYSSLMEGDGLSSYIVEAVQESNPNWEMDEESVTVLETMQHLHDRVNVSYWKDVIHSMDEYIASSEVPSFGIEFAAIKDEAIAVKIRQEAKQWGLDEYEMDSHSSNKEQQDAP